MARDIPGLTVAITGASSGIGRAAALAFARAGAVLVIGARRELLLGQLASEIQEVGSRALAVPLDVADHGSVQHMAHKGHEAFGKIDVWINNAGVGLFARFHEPEMELHQRVITTNLMGAMYGASAALPHLKESHGVLINNACWLGVTGAPFATSYAAAAAGIRAMSASLRQEFRTMGVDVCTLLPRAVHTPFYEHAGNFTGHIVHPRGVAIEPEEVAAAMVRLVRHPRGEVFAGAGEARLKWMQAFRPNAAERLTAERFERQEIMHVHAELEEGNLFEPVHTGGGARGDPFTVVSPRGRASVASRFTALGLGLVAALRAR